LGHQNKGRRSRIKNSGGDRVFLCFVYIYLALSLIIVLYPLVFIVSSSFSDSAAVAAGKVWLWPVSPSIRGYQAVFKNQQIVTGFANSFFYMIAGTAISLVMTILAAYPLARKEFIGRNILMTLFLFTMLFSGGLIPHFLLIQRLGIYNTRWALLIPAALNVWNLIIMRTYYRTAIPDEFYEVACLDGCDDLRCLLFIVLPLSGPILAVMALYYGVGQWNSYFDAMIYLREREMFPLQIILRNILILNQLDGRMVQDVSRLERMQGIAQLLKYAIIVVSSGPLLILYPFVQKYFVKGVMIGAIKG
jgi:multiple sugar transport system permease protein/putative aldouronate transport system permease protein